MLQDTGFVIESGMASCCLSEVHFMPNGQFRGASVTIHFLVCLRHVLNVATFIENSDFVAPTW